MFHKYCLDCDVQLPNVWPWTIGNEDGLCSACDDKRWGIGQEDEEESEETDQ